MATRTPQFRPSSPSPDRPNRHYNPALALDPRRRRRRRRVIWVGLRLGEAGKEQRVGGDGRCSPGQQASETHAMLWPTRPERAASTFQALRLGSSESLKAHIAPGCPCLRSYRRERGPARGRGQTSGWPAACSDREQPGRSWQEDTQLDKADYAQHPVLTRGRGSHRHAGRPVIPLGARQHEHACCGHGVAGIIGPRHPARRVAPQSGRAEQGRPWAGYARTAATAHRVAARGRPSPQPVVNSQLLPASAASPLPVRKPRSRRHRC